MSLSKLPLVQFEAPAEALATLFHPHVEVILHDFTSNKIAAIFNNFSKRKVGDNSLLENDLKTYEKIQVLGPYEKTNWDGRKLKSITSVLRNEKGKVIGLMCINFDISKLNQFQTFIQTFLHPSHSQTTLPMLFEDDWREKINTYIDQHLRTRHQILSALTKQEHVELILHLHQKGAFNGKNSATYIGQVLGISRATVYNYLKNVLE
jgi:predicted transcriptional regulator YheO